MIISQRPLLKLQKLLKEQLLNCLVTENTSDIFTTWCCCRKVLSRLVYTSGLDEVHTEISEETDSHDNIADQKIPSTDNVLEETTEIENYIQKIYNIKNLPRKARRSRGHNSRWQRFSRNSDSCSNKLELKLKCQHPWT